ncbi:hypothetical protein SCREM1_92 [Synechococcus phage S-CREM1]|nr:hypothetical protein SCREM1_92 [Synechococcus phage S-CREM1]
MNKQSKLILALMQVDNISKLMEGNQWEHFTKTHLLPLKFEFERQLVLEKHVETLGKGTGRESA